MRIRRLVLLILLCSVCVTGCRDKEEPGQEQENQQTTPAAKPDRKQSFDKLGTKSERKDLSKPKLPQHLRWLESLVKVHTLGKPRPKSTWRDPRYTCIAFSPDSTMLAAGHTSGMLRIWNIKDGQIVKTLAAHPGGVRAIAFSPDGSCLVTGGAAKSKSGT